MIGSFDHPWLSGLFGDDRMGVIWSSDRTLAHMLAFESAWSRALGDHEAAQGISTAAIDIADLAVGTGRDGVVVPALVKQLRASVAGEIHTGATSQDVVDSALSMTLRDTSDLIANQLDQLIIGLDKLADAFGAKPMMGRTRMQAATPITVGDRLRAWRDPLARHAERLGDLRPKVEVVQIGGASGNRVNVSDDFVAGVAAELGLRAVPCWHSERDGIAEYANFLSMITGSLGKIGQDVCLMAQQGIGEISLSGGGGSSAMPHKQNPVLAELLVTLARFNAVQLGGMHQSMVHEQERSGAAWALEWMILPSMAMATGRALSAAIDLIGNIERIGDQCRR